MSFRRRLRRHLAREAERVSVSQESLTAMAAATFAEGRRLAERCRAGELTRAELEAAAAQTGDGEPRIALLYLDRWT